VILPAGYRPLRLIRANGRIAVYDAWSESRACRCVAKIARAGAPRHERRMLLQEGRLLLALAHPHIVRAYEVHTRPRPFVVLEALPGETLSRVIERRRRGLPARDLAFLGIHLCSALQYLHRHGILHLDLKPSNVICQAGIARVIDLGLAKGPGRGRRGVGTPQYMAPEQVRGAAVSAATDVFSLGAVLYAAATRHAPFRSRDGVASDGVRRAPRISRRRLPPPLARTIERCLDPEPSDRPTVLEVLRELRLVAGLGGRA
jgi:serine/threonine protein kinase